MKQNMTYDEVIKAETILNLSNELLKTTVLNMKQYSDDPTADSITNAAVYLFIKTVIIISFLIGKCPEAVRQKVAEFAGFKFRLLYQ